MRFRLYPTPDQAAQLQEHCCDARCIWNLALEQRNYYRLLRRPSPNPKEQSRDLTELRAAHDWIAAGSSTAQQQALRDLNQAFDNWWGNPGHFGRPTWRIKGRHESFRIVGAQAKRYERLSKHRARVNVPKVGWVDFRWSKPPGNPKSYRIKQDTAGRWWISFAVKPEPLKGPGDESSVGIDRGVAHAFITSEGDFHDLPKLRPTEKKRLCRLQRKLARQQKGFSRRERTKQAIAKLKHREINRSKDSIEKLTTSLVASYDQIYLEDLKTQAMTRSAKGTIEQPGANVRAKAALNREILASGWGLFARRLEDKAPGRIIKINPAYTSQTCNACGITDRNSRQSQTLFLCRSCRHQSNADINAAKNIQAAGQAVSGRGGTVRPVAALAATGKPDETSTTGSALCAA